MDDCEETVVMRQLREIRTFSNVVIFVPLSRAADMASRDCRGFLLGGGRFAGSAVDDETAADDEVSGTDGGAGRVG